LIARSRFIELKANVASSIQSGQTMAEPNPSIIPGRGLHRLGGTRIAFFCICGTLAFAWLGAACGSKTERVISKIPEVIGTAGSNAAGGSAGGTQAQDSGGSVTMAGASGTSLLRAVGDPIGFAALGSGGTTGGGLRVPDVPSDCTGLKTLLEDAASRVILVKGKFDCTTSATTVPTCELSCDSSTGDTTRTVHRAVDSTVTSCSGIDGATATTPLVANQTRNEQQIGVHSNKTLLGTGSASIISGATFYLGPTISNVIIQNLVLNNVNSTLAEAGDAITIDGAHHVWVDHCAFSLISDGFIDTPSSSATTSATNITVSWNHFDGNNPASCSGQHNYANTIENALVTFHHNFWDTTLGTSPKITKTSAKVHLFNNYWLNVMYYSIGVDKLAEALIENNDFNNSNRPYWGMNTCIDKANCAISDSSGSNIFEGISSDTAESKNTGGTLQGLPAYTTQLDAASNVKARVTQGAGPTLTVSQ
jgi:pectate lyase